MMALIVMVLAGIDTSFYIWIMISLNNIVISLAARRQTAKHLLYQNFRTILAISLFSSFCWALYSLLVVFGDNVNRNWKQVTQQYR
jgi:amino acid permease